MVSVVKTEVECHKCECTTLGEDMNADRELSNDPAYETVCNESRDAAIQRMEQDAESEALIRSRVVSSIVLRGDLSALTEEQLTRYYASLCESLSLDVRFKPFDVLNLSGKKVLYANRGCTDALARINCLQRDIIQTPHVVDFNGTKVIQCVARVTLPSGRSETATATLPCTDVVNATMKCETKAKRRATLAILGLGILDSMELETIPGAKLPQDAPQSSGEAPTIVPWTLDGVIAEAMDIKNRSDAPRAKRVREWQELCETATEQLTEYKGMTWQQVSADIQRRLK